MADKADKLSQIKMSVEKMNKFHQINILKLLSAKETLTINENNNGVFINLTDLEDGILEELSDYISYVDEQEFDLNEQEEKKAEYKNVFFSNDVVNNDDKTKKVRIVGKENKDKCHTNSSKNDPPAELA